MNRKITDADLKFAEEFRAYYTSLNPTAGERDELDTFLDFKNGTRKYRVYVPKKIDQDAPTILIIHGGGWMSGDIETHDVIASALANRNNAVTLSIEYSLAPEYAFPQGLEDCYNALLWLKDHITSFKGNSEKVVIAGDSAGGGLTASLAILALDRKVKLEITSLIMMYPGLSFLPDTESFKRLGIEHFPQIELMNKCARFYIGTEDKLLKQPLVSPFYADVSNFPPSLLLVGENDPLQDHIKMFAGKLTKENVKNEFILYPKMEHGFIQYFKAPENEIEGGKAMKRITEFIKENR